MLASADVHVLGLGLVAVLASLSVVQTATHHFEGIKLLSSRSATIEASVAYYNEWMDGDEQNYQRLSRGAFALALPLFLVSISVSPAVVCADCVLGVLLSCMMIPAGALLFGMSWKRLKPWKGLKNLFGW